MSEANTTSWPFTELIPGDDLDIDAIFGGGSPNNTPTSIGSAPVQQAAPPVPIPVPSDQIPAAKQSEETSADNPIAAAFEQKTMENAQKGLLERPPVFAHKGVKEDIEDTAMTFEELRIRKSEDFADLEEGKTVSWSVEYCGIRKEIKDPKGTTIISMKESIERSREFLEALRKSKDKNPRCYVKPKVTMKTKGIASYMGHFRTLEDARKSDKTICLVPSNDGRIYELHKAEQGEFIAPKHKVTEFQTIRAGFTPALPRIPMALMGQLITFFRSFMVGHEEYEAFAQIYWDKVQNRFFAYVPKQTVKKEHVEADLRDCPYNDEERYICYADIHSHNSMKAFFSDEDDWDERGTGLYMVIGRLDRFFPELEARISCGGSFASIDPEEIIEGLERDYPHEWNNSVNCTKEKRKTAWDRTPSVLDREELV